MILWANMGLNRHGGNNKHRSNKSLSITTPDEVSTNFLHNDILFMWCVCRRGMSPPPPRLSSSCYHGPSKKHITDAYSPGDRRDYGIVCEHERLVKCCTHNPNPCQTTFIDCKKRSPTHIKSREENAPQFHGLGRSIAMCPTWVELSLPNPVDPTTFTFALTCERTQHHRCGYAVVAIIGNLFGNVLMGDSPPPSQWFTNNWFQFHNTCIPVGMPCLWRHCAQYTPNHMPWFGLFTNKEFTSFKLCILSTFHMCPHTQ